MTSQERAAQVLDMKLAQQLGLMFADMIKEGFLKGYKTGQEDMRERTAKLLDTERTVYAEDVRALPIE